MANIRVNLSHSIANGETVTFRSPTNCSAVTGLIVYYPNGGTTASKTFQFADAHGNNVGSKDLFAADVLVKVILDTELSRAYVQNADTNAYLEAELAKRMLSQKRMFMVSGEGRTINTRGWYRVCSIDLSPDGYWDGTSFIMSISHVHSGSTAETLQVLVGCNERNPSIIVLGGGSDIILCYSKVRLTFDKTNTKFNFDIYWDADYQNQFQTPNFIVFLNGRHTHKSHEEIFTAVPLTLLDTLPSTESVIKEHIVKPIGSGNILTDESGVNKAGDTMTGGLDVNLDGGVASLVGTQHGAYFESWEADYSKRRHIWLGHIEDQADDAFALTMWNASTNVSHTILHSGNAASIIQGLIDAGSLSAGVKIATGTYRGSGSGSRTFTFPFPPTFVAIVKESDDSHTNVLVRGQKRCYVYGQLSTATWSGNSLSLSATQAAGAYNTNENFCYVALA